MTDVQLAPASREGPRRWFRTGLQRYESQRAPIVVIAAVAVLALALRLYYLSRPGFLSGVTEYDDGSYFGSAVRLVNGQLPYRDFVFVQPPGITLLMAPVALVAKVTGTARALALGRILTVLAGTAGVVLTGLLVRSRGILAVLLACGICAVHPDSIAASHTVLVEPWLVLFCLLGALAVFDGDRLATGPRIAWGGAALGFAGVIEAWAIVPVVVLIVLNARQPRWTAVFAGGVAAGFLIPTAPFVIAAPRSFYQSVIVAQIGHRAGATRVYGVYRLRLMAGLSDIRHLPDTAVLAVAALILAVVIGGMVLACVQMRQLPSALECFSAAVGAVMSVIFLWPPQFHYHFVGFLVPFLGMTIGLVAARITTAIRSPARPRSSTDRMQRGVSLLAAAAILAGAAIQVSFERTLHAGPSAAQLAAVQRVIPPGACVLADEVSYTIVADRFISREPDCPAIDDGTGANYALSRGLNTRTGAGAVPAVAALWLSAFRHSQFIWLSPNASRRIPWAASLTSYFRAHFSRVHGLAAGIYLYQRSS